MSLCAKENYYIGSDSIKFRFSSSRNSLKYSSGPPGGDASVAKQLRVKRRRPKPQVPVKCPPGTWYHMNLPSGQSEFTENWTQPNLEFELTTLLLNNCNEAGKDWWLPNRWILLHLKCSPLAFKTEENKCNIKRNPDFFRLKTKRGFKV